MKTCDLQDRLLGRRELFSVTSNTQGNILILQIKDLGIFYGPAVPLVLITSHAKLYMREAVPSLKVLTRYSFESNTKSRTSCQNYPSILRAIIGILNLEWSLGWNLGQNLQTGMEAGIDAGMNPWMRAGNGSANRSWNESRDGTWGGKLDGI